MGKGEIARYEQFLLFPQGFQKACFPGASKGAIVWEWVNSLSCSLLLRPPHSSPPAPAATAATAPTAALPPLTPHLPFPSPPPPPPPSAGSLPYATSHLVSAPPAAAIVRQYHTITNFKDPV